MPDGYVNPTTGQKRYAPGAPTSVDATRLGGVGPAAKGVIGLAYEGPLGGEPLVAREITSATALKAIWPAEMAQKIAKLLFQPSKDPRVPAGASKLILVRANPATRAQLVITNADGDVATVSAYDWGLFGNEIQVKVEAGTTSGKKFTALNGSYSQVADNAGDMDAFSAEYTAPGGTPPAGWALATLTIAVDPNAADGSPAVTVAYNFTGPQAVAGIDPRTWMAFDGSIRIAIGAQAAGASRTFAITGVLKAAYDGHAAGASYTESVVVASSGATTSGATWSDITLINPPDVLDGDATYTGSAFALNKRASTGAAQYDTIAKVVDRINAFSARGFAGTLETTERSLPVSSLDKVATPQTIKGASYTVPADLYHFLKTVAASVSYVTLTRAAAATGVPANVVYTNLVGGADGIAGTGAGGDWSKAIDAFEDQYVNSVVVWSDSLTAAADIVAVGGYLNAHCAQMCGEGEDERNCYIGVPGGSDYDSDADGLLGMQLVLSSRHMTLTCQQIQDYVGSTLTTFEPNAYALLLAAVEAGRIVGTGITRKTLNIAGFVDNPGVAATDWTVPADKEKLIEHGYALVEKFRGGYRVLRGNTSYTADENPIYSSIVANASANQSAKNLRLQMEDFIGEENTVPEGVIRSEARKELDRQVGAKEIRAYDPLTIEIVPAGNAFQVKVTVAVTEEYLWAPITVIVDRLLG